jgi:hypothetical protein
MICSFDKVGIREARSDLYAPFARISAELKGKDGKKIWSASALSTELHTRAKREYENKPELYKEDFREVAADLAEQLVKGPMQSLPE